MFLGFSLFSVFLGFNGFILFKTKSLPVSGKALLIILLSILAITSLLQQTIIVEIIIGVTVNNV